MNALPTMRKGDRFTKHNLMYTYIESFPDYSQVKHIFEVEFKDGTRRKIPMTSYSLFYELKKGVLKKIENEHFDEDMFEL